MLKSNDSETAKRLALVITELEPGGAERCLVEIAIGLDRSKFSPVVVSLAPPPADAERQILIERLRHEGVPIHFLNVRRAWDFFAAVRQLADLFRSEQIELVQTFLFHVPRETGDRDNESDECRNSKSAPDGAQGQ